ncbi:hypothetical protein F5Y12DRAFT_31263 [Xylaria sp. FL1777]|nr:hypothetical protein F5Y12DRAFT_31263 [Xylaria sp. FL1777]
MAPHFSPVLSTASIVLSGVFAVYDFCTDVVSDIASDIDYIMEKTGLSTTSWTDPAATTSAAAAPAEEGLVGGDDTATPGPDLEEGDGWEQISGANDNGSTWNEVEDDYYSSGDDITIEEYIENGEWLHLNYTKASQNEQPQPPLSLEEEAKKPEPPLPTPRPRPREKEKKVELINMDSLVSPFSSSERCRAVCYSPVMNVHMCAMDARSLMIPSEYPEEYKKSMALQGPQTQPSELQPKEKSSPPKTKETKSSPETKETKSESKAEETTTDRASCHSRETVRKTPREVIARQSDRVGTGDVPHGFYGYQPNTSMATMMYDGPEVELGRFRTYYLRRRVDMQ